MGNSITACSDCEHGQRRNWLIQVVFERKPSSWLWDVVIETATRLPKEEYEQFLGSPCDGYEFIEKNSKSMLMDEKNGVFRCMLVTDEGYRDGVLMEVEDYPCTRYASYVLGAITPCYESLSKMNEILARVVGEIVKGKTSVTITGNWMIDRSRVETLLGEGQSENPRLWILLQGMLGGRSEVAQVGCMDEGLDIYYYLDFCPNYTSEGGGAAAQEAGADVKSPRLKDILCTRWESVHLAHTEVDSVLHVIVGLGSGTLAKAGKKVWTDVLNTKVERAYQGLYGLQMELSGIKSSRLDAFPGMLRGYCSEQEYETWARESEKEPVSPQLNNS